MFEEFLKLSAKEIKSLDETKIEEIKTNLTQKLANIADMMKAKEITKEPQSGEEARQEIINEKKYNEESEKK